MVENIIEYIDVDEYQDLLKEAHDNVISEENQGFIECTSRSWLIRNGYLEHFRKIIDAHESTGFEVCKKSSGLNFNETHNTGLPPHIDVNDPPYYNLLIPLFGTATINIYETPTDHFEFRHGCTNWKMCNDDYRKSIGGLKKIGSILVDKPTLLDTDYAHDVCPVDTPRLVWCSRFINLDKDYTFKEFKEILECRLKRI